MKKTTAKTIFLICSFLLLAGFAQAEQIVNETPALLVTERITLTADAAGVALPGSLTGGYLFQVEMKCSLDDTVNFSIATGNGVSAYSLTGTTAASTGYIQNPSGYWVFSKTAPTPPKYTISGIGSGNCVVEVTVARK